MFVRIASALALCVALSFGALGCGDTPSEEDCAKLLDHIIDIEVKAAGTGELTPEMKSDLDAQKREIKTYLKKQFMDQCMEKTPVEYVECGLEAQSYEELAACEKT